MTNTAKKTSLIIHFSYLHIYRNAKNTTKNTPFLTPKKTLFENKFLALEPCGFPEGANLHYIPQMWYICSIKQQQIHTAMNNWTQIEETLRRIVEEMGGNADQINNGDCVVFAKKAYNQLTKLGIDVEIVNNLSDEMQDELDGYSAIPAKYSEGISHCYLLIDGWYFDAFDVDGAETEQDLQYHIKCLN
jgi:hypothetical protein